MATQLTRDIPNFGTATLRIPGFGLVMHLRQATDEVEEPKRAALFTNRLLAAMLVEPRMAPEEIQNLPTDSVTNLTQAAADALEIREHYERTSPRLPAEVRFYEAYIRQEREFFESFNDAMRQYSAGLKDSLHGLFHDFAHTAGLTAQIISVGYRLLFPSSTSAYLP
jgi:hypothetical protein